MAFECLWNCGELGGYYLSDFDPNGLSSEKIIEKASEELKNTK